MEKENTWLINVTGYAESNAVEELPGVTIVDIPILKGSWRISEMTMSFLAGQGGALFITPEIVDILGSISRLITFPFGTGFFSGVTGDGQVINLHNFPTIFDPGSVLRFSIMVAAGTVFSRLYSIQILMEEVIRNA